MVGIVNSFVKTAVERKRLYVDYHCWLSNDEELVDFQVVVRPNTEEAPLVISTSFPDAENKRLMLYVSGGLGNTSYIVQMVVRTDEGQVKRDDMALRVLP